jgi:radical SAM superfamily enzyme YgiQ (UPF0313 family)
VSEKIVSLYRRRLAMEKGPIKKDWGGKISIGLAYPNHYRTGMSNLGFQVLYYLFNRKDNVVAERFFLPEGKEMSLHLEGGKGLLSLESQAPMGKFDLVAFSLSFENDYPNILKILDLGKIPLLADARDDSHPFVMSGGITTFLNPEPIAPFFDFFLLGEAEAIVDEFVESFTEIFRTYSGRRSFLISLAQQVKSLYVPSLYISKYDNNGTLKSMEPVVASIPEKVKVACHVSTDTPVNRSVILTPDTAFAERVLIELGRGCGRSCRFCAAGYVYRPPRVHEESKIRASIDEVMEDSNRIGLLSPAVSDIPGIEHITSYIVKKGGRFSVASLRADSLTEALIENLKRAGQKTLAIAPEAGSERLRKVINKHLTQDQIIEAATTIGRVGDFALRLYFLIGLPTEEKEDVDRIVELVKSIKHHIIKESRTRGRIRQIKLSLNCFVPKAFTPFQWFPMEDISTLKEKQKGLKKILEKEGGVQVNFDVPKWAYVQALLSMGDRRVGSILLLNHEFKGDWNRSFRHSDLNPDFFVYRPKGLDEILPWELVDHGIDKAYLIKEYKLALKAKESDECQVGECERCGVCPAD